MTNRCKNTGAVLWRQAGFTLVELLVVIAIIGILVGFLVPAVQMVREAARRTECSNNIRQIALAFHMQHGSHQAFPSGGWDWFRPPNKASGRDQYAGWGYQILPYVEANAIFESDALTAIGTPNPIFFCPSRRSAQTVVGPDSYYPPFNVPTVPRALCDYAGSNRDQSGAIMRIEPLRFRDIVDGTSNTLLVGEKRMNLWLLGQLQDDDNEGYSAGWNEDTIRRTDLPPARDYTAPAGDGEKLFGSAHPTTLNFSMCDGSTHSIPFTVDADLFGWLGNRDDGQTVTLD